MESVEEIKQPGRPQNAALRAAFPATVPVLTGYLCLGMAYGLLMSASGYGPLWAVFMSILVFGGSIQYVAVTLLTAAFAPVQAFLISVMVNARHVFYGLSLLKKYQGMGRVRPLLIYKRQGLHSGAAQGCGAEGFLLLDFPAELQLLGVRVPPGRDFRIAADL